MLFSNSLDISYLIEAWKSNLYRDNIHLFEECYKFDLITNTVFSIYAFLGTLSALVLTVFVIICPDLFSRKISATYLYYNYLVWGPFLFTWTTLGLLNWHSVMYNCNKDDYGIYNFEKEKRLAFGTIFTIVSFFFISLIITIAFTLFHVISVYIDVARGGTYASENNVKFAVSYFFRKCTVRR